MLGFNVNKNILIFSLENIKTATCVTILQHAKKELP